jgi:ssDNA-binding Zn-finger/Zn-ribbon topoisomerase 1
MEYWELIPDDVKEKINSHYEQNKTVQTYGTCSYCGGNIILTEIEGIYGYFCSDCVNFQGEFCT